MSSIEMRSLGKAAIWLLLGTVALAGTSAAVSMADEKPAVGPDSADLSDEQLKFFESKIRPVLIKECYGCHSNQSGNVRGGLRLDTRELTHIGGGSGPAIVPGDPAESLLFNAMNHEDWVMPPKRKLAQHVLDDFREWIEMGAPDPRITEIGEIKSSISEEDIEQARSTFWAYQKPVKEEPPQVEDSTWSEGAIDQFVLAKLEESDLQPAEDAAAHKVLRRLCFDLVGLPPTPEQIDYFEKAWSKDPQQAIAFVVDRLLDQEQFGERWGRYWLDVARYAESTGREVNLTYPHAWRYRDYVIDSFNADKPFNLFVQEQIAGDLMPTESNQDWAENLVATTFLAMGAKNVNEQNRVQFAADLLDEQIDATTRVFLGTSVSCARCHDHKFDAIPQTDYYALAGVFSNMTTYFGNPPSEFGSFATPQRKQHSSLIVLPIEDPNPYDKKYSRQELEALRGEITGTMQEAAEMRRNRDRNGGNAAQVQRQRIQIANRLSSLSDELAVVDKDGNPRSYCMGVQERDPPRDAKLLVRGEIDQQAQTVARGFPQVLCSTPQELPRNASGRLELARWIGSDQNTLAARVMVNRIWQHLIGKGIVTSPENFGVTGAMPTHPELLDYLAVRFVESGWSVKSIVREIATSRIYRIDSTFNEDYHEEDPDNRLVWRANPRRLDAEAMRDAMLSISGELDFERPRGSEVAKAGFMRVRGGVIGDPREMMRKAFESAGEDMRRSMQSAMRNRGRRPGGQGAERQVAGRSSDESQVGPGFGAGRRQGRPERRPGGGAPSEDMRQSFISQAARSVTHQLDMEQATFRSVYLPIVRNEIPRSLDVFDFADASTITGQRETSNTPNQALYMLNNPFVLAQSDSFAQRVAQHSNKPSEQIEFAFRLAYGREPTSGERSATASFVRQFAASSGGRNRGDGWQTLSAVCQGLFASAEFRFID